MLESWKSSDRRELHQNVPSFNFWMILTATEPWRTEWNALEAE